MPRAMSRRPVYRERTSWVTAVSAMKRLAPPSRATAVSRAVSSAGTSKVCRAPAEVRTAGRGRSAGSSRGSVPASFSRQ
ncbi:hypothetical protein EES47_07120 [Streptomyces sp. ADI98-12]|nr:hypothetical protein EES47_07120 [Streptomyces sp. ADI98-12]